MAPLLLASLALSLSAAPAAAQLSAAAPPGGGQFSAPPGSFGGAPSHWDGGRRGDHSDHDRWRRHHRFPRPIVVGGFGWYPSGDREEPRTDEWWHDNVARSYPRWVQQQQREGQGCAPERMWQSGGVWRC
jgi:hypothetical protein